MEQSVYRAKLLCKDTWVIYLGDTTAYLIAGEREGMMIDSGNTPGPLREFCEETCGRPVRLVANTHGHFDHIQANDILRDKTGAPLGIHADDAELLETPEKAGSD